MHNSHVQNRIANANTSHWVVARMLASRIGSTVHSMSFSDRNRDANACIIIAKCLRLLFSMPLLLLMGQLELLINLKNHSIKPILIVHCSLFCWSRCISFLQLIETVRLYIVLVQHVHCSYWFIRTHYIARVRGGARPRVRHAHMVES